MPQDPLEDVGGWPGSGSGHTYLDRGPTDALMLEEKLSSLPDDFGSKIRKHYTITKQRERWTDEEHQKFLDALKLHGRAWRRIEEHIGTKTTVQIRSHAQKFFTKVEREQLGGTVSDLPLDISIPPPRPKRKPNHPYPRKAGGGCSRGSTDMETNNSPSSTPVSYASVKSVDPPLEEESYLPATNAAILTTLLHSIEHGLSDTAAITKPEANKLSPILKLFGQNLILNEANNSVDSTLCYESAPADSGDCETLVTAPCEVTEKAQALASASIGESCFSPFQNVQKLESSTEALPWTPLGVIAAGSGQKYAHSRQEMSSLDKDLPIKQEEENERNVQNDDSEHTPDLNFPNSDNNSLGFSFVGPDQLTIFAPLLWLPTINPHSLDNSAAGKMPEGYPMAMFGLPPFSIESTKSDVSTVPNTPTPAWWALQASSAINPFTPSIGLFYNPAGFPLLSASDKFMPPNFQLEQAQSKWDQNAFSRSMQGGQNPCTQSMQDENGVQNMVEETQTEALTSFKMLKFEGSPTTSQSRLANSNQTGGSTDLTNSSCNGSCSDGQCEHGSFQIKHENFTSESDQKRFRRESTSSTCSFVSEDVNSRLRTKDNATICHDWMKKDDGSPSANGGPSSTSSGCGNSGGTSCSNDGGVSTNANDSEDTRLKADGDTQSIAPEPQEASNERRMAFRSAMAVSGSSSTTYDFPTSSALSRSPVKAEGRLHSAFNSTCTPPATSLSTVTINHVQDQGRAHSPPASSGQVSAFRRLYSLNARNPEHAPSEQSQKFGGKKGLTVSDIVHPAESAQASRSTSPTAAKGEDAAFKGVGFVPYHRP